MTISDPISTSIRAGADVVVATLQYVAKIRETASPEARDAQDRIAAQAYWDWRAVLESVGIVGAPIPWPPK